MKSIEKINSELFLVIEVDLKSVSTENKFFKLMNEIFGFPSYYWHSFDSLDDCMRDLGLWSIISSSNSKTYQGYKIKMLPYLLI